VVVVQACEHLVLLVQLDHAGASLDPDARR